jgi:hypothetical protein
VLLEVVFGTSAKVGELFILDDDHEREFLDAVPVRLADSELAFLAGPEIDIDKRLLIQKHKLLVDK